MSRFSEEEVIGPSRLSIKNLKFLHIDFPDPAHNDAKEQNKHRAFQGHFRKCKKGIRKQYWTWATDGEKEREHQGNERVVQVERDTNRYWIDRWIDGERDSQRASRGEGEEEFGGDGEAESNQKNEIIRARKLVKCDTTWQEAANSRDGI